LAIFIWGIQNCSICWFQRISYAGKVTLLTHGPVAKKSVVVVSAEKSSFMAKKGFSSYFNSWQIPYFRTFLKEYIFFIGLDVA
jgi:hypothetical protein